MTSVNLQYKDYLKVWYDDSKEVAKHYNDSSSKHWIGDGDEDCGKFAKYPEQDV